ncbi:hypothetical protein QFZ31_005743 [Neobacillus niacini]|nr:hypothetical protein [Neobacillus niacini]
MDRFLFRYIDSYDYYDFVKDLDDEILYDDREADTQVYIA